jgi:hypothetical protein
MSLSVHIERDLSLAHIDHGQIWLTASDDEGKPLSLRVPVADWSYLSSRPHSMLDDTDADEFAFQQIEKFLLNLELDAVPESRLVTVAMTDRI